MKRFLVRGVTLLVGGVLVSTVGCSRMRAGDSNTPPPSVTILGHKASACPAEAAYELVSTSFQNISTRVEVIERSASGVTLKSNRRSNVVVDGEQHDTAGDEKITGSCVGATIRLKFADGQGKAIAEIVYAFNGERMTITQSTSSPGAVNVVSAEYRRVQSAAATPSPTPAVALVHDASACPVAGQFTRVTANSDPSRIEVAAASNGVSLINGGTSVSVDGQNHDIGDNLQVKAICSAGNIMLYATTTGEPSTAWRDQQMVFAGDKLTTTTVNRQDAAASPVVTEYVKETPVSRD